MTDEGRRTTDWDDDRLVAAFQARAAAIATPHDLADIAIERLRRRPDAGRRSSRVAWLGGLAATAAVAVVAVSLALRPAVGPAADGPAAFGLQIVSVAQAAAIRDGGADGRELAVAGFYTSGGRVSCPAPIGREVNPTHVTCPATLNWLMEQPEKLLTVSGESTSWHHPTGPAIQPGFALVSADGLVSGPSEVVSVILIGHFDDRRASLCSDDTRSACADTFLVDRIQQVGDTIIPTVTIAERDPILDEPTADAAVRTADSGLEILSRRVVDSDHLVDTEPLLATARFSHFTDFEEPLLWVVIAIAPSADGSPVQARTFVVPDALNSALIGEMTATDVLSITLTASAEPIPTPTSSSTSNPTPTESAQPNPATTWVGDPITVSEAIDHRDHHLDDTELAVRGFGWSPTIFIPCGPRLVVSPAYNECVDTFTWIAAEQPRGIDQAIRPAGPALNLLLRPDAFEGVELGGEPTDVIVMGHFDDHRAISCPAELIAQCRRNFIVDAILDPAWPRIDRDAVESHRPSGSTAGTFATPEDVERAVPIEHAAGTPLVIAIFPVTGAEAASYEPQAAQAPEITSARAVWILRYLETVEDERPIIRTRLIIDGRPADLPRSIYVPTKDGLMREITIID